MMKRSQRTCPDRGFSMIELVVVLVIIGVLSAIALPSYLQWRQGLEARETARDIASALRKAKSQAISTNLEQRVHFDATNRGFGMSAGDRAYSSSTWTGPTSTTNIKRETSFTSTNSDVCFNPNGTSTDCAGNPISLATFTAQNSTGTRKITITVSGSGYIKIK